MNDLSWLLYFGDVIGNVQGLCIFMSILAVIACIIATIIWFCTFDDYNGTEHAQAAKALRFAIPIAVAISLMACLLPSKETVYLIAASETGEQVLQSPTGKKAVDAINRYLDSVGHSDNK